MKILSRTVGLLEENCYLVIDETTGDAVLIDPGADGDDVLDMVEESGARLTAVWLTHAHIDHIGAISAVRAVYQVPVHLHPADTPVYESQSVFAEGWGIPFEQPEPADATLSHDETVRVGSLSFRVVHAPGHSPGHVVFHGHGILISGDILFEGTVGRTDIPLANPSVMAETLEMMKTFPPETVVYPGHGETTTIAAEIRDNPFLNGNANVKRYAN